MQDSLTKLVNYELCRTVMFDLILQILKNRTMGSTEVNGQKEWREEAHGIMKDEGRAACD